MNTITYFENSVPITNVNLINILEYNGKFKPEIHRITLDSKNIDKKDMLMEILQLLFFEQQKTKAVDRKVGAVLLKTRVNQASLHYDILKTGHNTMWSDLGDECEYEDGESKEFVIHAEENIIFNTKELHKSFANWMPINNYQKFPKFILFTTLAPCMLCSRLIKHAGIDMIVFLEKHKWKFDFVAVANKTSPAQFLLDSKIRLLYLNIV